MYIHVDDSSSKAGPDSNTPLASEQEKESPEEVGEQGSGYYN